MNPELKAAIWAGDVDKLNELAPCGCCCHEHTHAWCIAREWGGCRSGLGPGEVYPDDRAWQKHYEKFHGMSESEFYGRDNEDI